MNCVGRCASCVYVLNGPPDPDDADCETVYGYGGTESMFNGEIFDTIHLRPIMRALLTVSQSLTCGCRMNWEGLGGGRRSTSSYLHKSRTLNSLRI